MKTMRVGGVVILAVLLIGLSGCFTESDNPLSDPATAVADEDLIGLWVQDQKDGTRLYKAVGRLEEYAGPSDKPKGLMCMSSFSFDKAGHLSPGKKAHTFFVNAIGKEKFANQFETGEAVQEVEKDGRKVPTWSAKGIKTYQLYKYEVTKDKLVIWYCWNDVAAKLIDSGKLAGKVEREDDKRVKSARLTGSTTDLVRFLSKGGSKDLFPDKDEDGEIIKEEFRRVK